MSEFLLIVEPWNFPAASPPVPSGVIRFAVNICFINPLFFRENLLILYKKKKKK